MAARRMIGLGWALLVTMIPAHANSPEPSREVFAAVEKTCTAAGAFGYRFGASHATARDTGLPPFIIETLSESRNGLFEIVATASFAKAPMSGEDRIALAGWVSQKLDTDIAAARQFLHREPRRDGVQFIAAGFTLAISQDGTAVRLTCTDLARRRAVNQEGRKNR
jgi:hypothetical protein